MPTVQWMVPNSTQLPWVIAGCVRWRWVGIGLLLHHFQMATEFKKIITFRFETNYFLHKQK